MQHEMSPDEYKFTSLSHMYSFIVKLFLRQGIGTYFHSKPQQ